MASNVSNVKIEPVTVSWASQETWRVTTVADSSGSLSATYFTMSAALDATDFYVWFDVAGGSVDPAPAGRTGIEVDISTDDTAATIAGLMVTAIDANANFNAKIDPDNSDQVIIQAAAHGAATDTADVDTGFTFAQEVEGGLLDLGLIDGDIEITTTEDFADITAHSEGTNILEKIRTGKNVDAVSIALKESNAAKLQSILEISGGSVTPAGGTKVSGWGKNSNHVSLSSVARKLVLHPVRLASSDRSADWCFWRSHPTFDGTNFSGESEQLVNLSFNVVPDCLVDEDIRLVGYGDHLQNLLK